MSQTRMVYFKPRGRTLPYIYVLLLVLFGERGFDKVATVEAYDDGATALRIEFKSQSVSFETANKGRYARLPVYTRRVRFSVKNSSTKTAVVIRSENPIQVSNEGDRFSESFIWPTDMLYPHSLAAYIWFLEAGQEHEFEVAYPHDRAFQTEFSVAYDPSESDEIEWINLHEEKISASKLRWVRARTSQIGVKVPAANGEQSVPQVIVTEMRPTRREVRHDSGDIEVVCEWRCTFRVQNSTKQRVFIVWNEPLNFGLRDQAIMIQCLNWSPGAMFRRMPTLYTRSLKPGRHFEITGEYASANSFETAFAYTVPGDSEEFAEWERLDNTNSYRKQLEWIRSKLKVLRVKVPIYAVAPKIDDRKRVENP